MDRCLTNDEVAKIVEGHERPAFLDEHIDRCDRCFEVLAAAMADAVAPASPQTALVAERYALKGVIGSGGMGRVLLAHDTILDRRVALKILRSEVFGSQDIQAARDRLRTEARLMAGLSHPNIVHVYDVGDTDDTVFIAMEYVPGTSVDAWIRNQAPSVPTIVRALAGAARGLAAAHKRGIVHRDIKPSNLLLDTHQHVRVSDFGLALSYNEGDSSVFSGSGTPAFMAPEQARDGRASPAADQYAFGLTLWSVLCGRPPVDLDEVRAAIDDPALPWPVPTMHGIPRRVARVIRRTIAPEPELRYSSMADVAQALEATRRRSSGWLPALALGGLGIAGFATAMLRDADVCQQFASRADQLWTNSARSRVAAAMSHTLLGDGEPLVSTTTATIDAHVETWRDGAHQACKTEAIQAPTRESSRVACFESKLHQLATYVEQLELPNDALLAAIPRALNTWTVEDCMSPGHRVAPDEASRKSLARARALRQLGRLGAAESSLPPDSEDRIVRAQSHVLRGEIAEERYDFAAARACYFNALVDATETDDVETQVEARLGLSSVELEVGGDTQRARTELELVYALLRRHPSPRLERDAAIVESNVLSLDNDPNRALEHFERWFAGRHDITAAHARMSLLTGVGRYAEAVEYGRSSIDRLRSDYGETHPLVAAAHSQLAITMVLHGSLDEALEQALASVRILDASGDDDRMIQELAESLNGLGMVHWRRREHDEATAAFERAISMMPVSSPDYGVTLDNLGSVLQQRGEFEEAEKVHRQAIEHISATHGDEHYEVGLAYVNLGYALFQHDRMQDAHAAFEEALRRNERARGPEHPQNASILNGMANTLIARKRYDEAIAVLRRALKISANASDHHLRAVLRQGLAIALERGPGDIETARGLMHEALQELEAWGHPVPELGYVRAWLDAHPEESP